MSAESLLDAPKLVVVTGPESSGTRLLTDLLLATTGFAGDDSATEHLWRIVPDAGDFVNRGIPESIVNRTLRRELGTRSRVSRRSMPHGPLGDGRLFHDPKIFGLFAGCLGFDVRFALTTRDASIVRSSKSKTHTRGDAKRAATELDHAEKLSAGLLLSYFHVEIFSYESFMSLGEAYFKHFIGRLGLRSFSFRDAVPGFPELKDANPKYLK